ncbi:hypothetical protein BKA67DRAFT_144273 [Truncatella angustata]|uniref:Uncharacterized protein n=1 Tax=Truncatella angustata TaxID=152316 RepID=A0A9P8UA11_9PEZI|nr:uncharacterized protein BKA67DRAFT_144273 [Truncatella angustata]KAH6638554.1 hypothetical protein BKA67DRAFT_144273 [Truncatella angustata]
MIILRSDIFVCSRPRLISIPVTCYSAQQHDSSLQHRSMTTPAAQEQHRRH